MKIVNEFGVLNFWKLDSKYAHGMRNRTLRSSSNLHILYSYLEYFYTRINPFLLHQTKLLVQIRT